MPQQKNMADDNTGKKEKVKKARAKVCQLGHSGLSQTGFFRLMWESPRFLCILLPSAVGERSWRVTGPPQGLPQRLSEADWTYDGRPLRPFVLHK